ncbi:TBC1 domain family member 20 isoform X1 [Xiphophorus hellerii]|uniref:TBC1 domain family member 20 isoform X1 n=1 Tax=Xiphophorus hellerii TaxID=8084 RepID=UPI0013B420F6|nr:TBC1 domain family member 20-like isoform X1 [Xiphophorus hellerii]
MRKHKRKKQIGAVGGNENGFVTRESDGGRKHKLTVIHQALIRDPVDIEALRRAAAGNGGLLTDELRRKVWPKLLNINVYNLPPKPGREVRENHKDYNQVVLDVRRSMKRFPKGMPASERAVLQEQLINIILEVLKRNPQLHYYQGYHDVAVTLLLVVGERMSIAMLDTLSNFHLRDFMDPTMDSTKHILNYLMPILEQVDAELHDFMIRAEVGTIFALSWLITWYGHVLSEFRHTLRLYDFFLASHPLMPIYLAATIVLHREKEVKQTECDMAMVHHLLSHIPQDLPYELLICQAQDLFEQFPPSLLAKRAALQSRKRPGGFPACSPRPAVEGGEQDDEDGSVGAVRYARGRRVRRGSDRHGLGTRLDTSAVLMRPMGTGQEPLIKPKSFCNTSKRLTLTTWRSNLLQKEVFWCQKGYFHFSAKNPKHFGQFTSILSEMRHETRV